MKMAADEVRRLREEMSNARNENLQLKVGVHVEWVPPPHTHTHCDPGAHPPALSAGGGHGAN